TFTGFHYASRSQDPAGLLNGDATPHPRGLAIAGRISAVRAGPGSDPGAQARPRTAAQATGAGFSGL
ncbi:hypothetical protein, partial [Streptomyces jumonjinensis]|uniref:hypothetical protein n=1 Tax=Streptomyces jumonjinensis TaxID=1945 RepID=UPI001E285E85